MADLGLSGDMVHDGVTMVSELAANTLHAQGNAEFDGSRQRPITGSPELWTYVRSCPAGYEVVCKVFDSQRGWKSGAPPDPARVTLESVNGRGLRVVSELSAGRWGHHLTRARLGRWKVQGKAVWFALPVSEARARARLAGHPLSSCEAAKELEGLLIDRGIGRRLVRSEEPVADIAVLSIRSDLTVWFRGGMIAWTAIGGGYERRAIPDLIEAAEQVVRVHEELDLPAAPGLEVVPLSAPVPADAVPEDAAPADSSRPDSSRPDPALAAPGESGSGDEDASLPEDQD